MRISYGFIKEENRKQYESLVLLKDFKGKYALSSAHRKIIEYIGSMPRVSGCFSCEDTINEQSIRSTSKTLKRHLQYLVHIRALSVTLTKNRRIFRIESIVGPVVSLKEYRISRGMSEYAYADQKGNLMTEKNEELVTKASEPLDTDWFKDTFQANPIASSTPIFFENQVENFASETTNFAAKQANFAPILCNTIKNSKNELPPKGSLDNGLEDFLSLPVSNENELGGVPAQQADADETARPHSKGPVVPSGLVTSFKTEISKDEDWTEPLFSVKKKQPKNQEERRQVAMKDHVAGHLVNPLGITNNRPKKLNAKLARDIGTTGSVTIPQLYRHLIKLYDDAFGEGIIVQMLPDDKSAVNAWFGNLKQKFIDACKFTPSNRDVAEYFQWILEPSRAAKLLGAGTYSKKEEKGFVHFKQILGLAHIRKFYDQVLKKRLSPEQTGETVTLAMESNRSKVAEVEDAYKELKHADGNSEEFVFAMLSHGVALAAQWLHENKSLSATECRERIIQDMIAYVKASGDTKMGIKHLNLTIDIAKSNRKLLDEECVWFEIEKFTDSMVEEVIKKGEINVE